VDLGIKYFNRRELIGGTPKQNALIAEELLSSGGRHAIREAVLLNAGAALYVYSHAKNIRDGYLEAKDALETGKVKNKLEQIREEGKGLLNKENGDQE
jgi:anthranilate phosphoribosyltransferase